MPIQSKRGDDKLTIFTVTGKISFEEVMRALKRSYAGNPTSNILWDLRKGSATDLTYDNLVKISEYTAKVSGKRQGGKTALVSPSDVDYGILRTLDSFGEVYEFSFYIRAFRDYDEAIVWLESKQ